MSIYIHINLHDQSSAIGLLPAPPAVKINDKGRLKKVNGAATELGQLGAMWGGLLEDVKATIFTLANLAPLDTPS